MAFGDFESRDAAFEFFRTAGYSGLLEDMIYEYLIDDGMTPSSRIEMLHEMDPTYYSRNAWIQGIGRKRL